MADNATSLLPNVTASEIDNDLATPVVPEEAARDVALLATANETAYLEATSNIYDRFEQVFGEVTRDPNAILGELSSLQGEISRSVLGDVSEVAANEITAAAQTGDMDRVRTLRDGVVSFAQNAGAPASLVDQIYVSYQSFIDANPENVNDPDAQMAVAGMTLGWLLKALDSGSAVDKVLDFGGLLLPFAIKDTIDVFGTDAEENMRKWNTKFLSAGSALEQSEMLLDLAQRVIEGTDGNALKATNLLLRAVYPGEAGVTIADIVSDATAIGVPTALATAKSFLRLGTSTARNLAKANKDAAGAAVQQVLEGNPRATKAMGLTKEEAAVSGLGIEQGVLFNPKAAPEIAAYMEQAQSSRVMEVVQNMRALGEYLRNSQRGILTPEQMARAQQKAIEEFEESLAATSPSVRIESVYVNPNKANNVSAELVFRLRNESGEVFGARKEVVYPVNAVGDWLDLSFEKGLLDFEKLDTPTKLLRKFGDDIVSRVTIGENIRKEALRVTQKARDAALRGLPKEKVREVEALLDMGAKGFKMKGKRARTTGTYTLEQLKSGELGKVYDDDVIDAYYAYRALSDELYEIQNQRKRLAYAQEGYKTVKLVVDDKPTRVPGKPLADIEVRQLAKRDISVYDAETGKSVQLSALLNSGKNPTIVRLDSRVRVGKEWHQYAAVTSNNLLPLQRYVLPRVPGYVPRIDKDKITHIAVAVGEATVDGRPSKLFQVTHVFDSEVGAEKFLKSKAYNNVIRRYRRRGINIQDVRIIRRDQIAELRKALPKDEAVAFVRALDEMEEALSTGGVSGNTTGLGLGRRSSDEIRFGVEDESREFLGAIESFDAALQNVAVHYPMLTLRSQLVQKFYNTFRPYLSNPNDWRSEIVGAPVSGKHRSLTPAEIETARILQQYLTTLFTLRTPAERAWQARTLNAVKVIDKFILERTGSVSIRELRRKNPKAYRLLQAVRDKAIDARADSLFGVLRTVTFHNTLGFFSPVQLFTQASGAVIAFSRDPVAAVKLFPQYMRFRWLVFNNKWDDEMKALLKKGTDIDDETIEIVQRFQRSGFYASLFNDASLEVSRAGAALDQSSTIHALTNASLMFYREGELFSRGYSFLEAHQAFKKRFGRKPVSDRDWEWVEKRTLESTLNPTAANMAAWQRGALSIPTQFLQIVHKYYEQVVFPAFTYAASKLTGGAIKPYTAGTLAPEEAGKVMLLSFAVFGSSALPGLGSLLDSAVRWYEETTGKKLDENAIVALKGGWTDLFGKMLFGQQVDLSSRTSIAYGLTQLFDNITRAEDVGDMLLGVSNTFLDRVGEATKQLVTIAYRPFEDDQSVTVLDIEEALEAILSIPSSARNVLIGYRWLTEGVVYSQTTGAPIFVLEDSERAQLAVAKMLGIQPTKLTEYYTAKRVVADSEREMRDTVNMLRKLYTHYYSRAAKAETEEEAARYGKQLSRVLQATLHGMPDPMKAEIIERLNNALRADPDAMRVYRQAIIHSARLGEPLPGISTNNTIRDAVTEAVDQVNGQE